MWELKKEGEIKFPDIQVKLINHLEFMESIKDKKELNINKWILQITVLKL